MEDGEAGFPPTKRFLVTKLDIANHDRSRFESGSEPLDRWFHTQAGQQMRSRVAVVYVLIEQATERLAGFYTLSASGIDGSQITDDLKRKMKLPKYPHFPVILLGRLAVDKTFAKQGLGRVLLISAIANAARINTELGAVAIIVDAKDDSARQFYEHHQFIPFADNQNQLFLPATAFTEYLA